ncbi:MAG: hypothetical protein JXC36_03915 [Candidatus Atribacteria bacterium]|nr:hypothetical protein [Candidatus Atribacteria bacterium]
MNPKQQKLWEELELIKQTNGIDSEEYKKKKKKYDELIREIEPPSSTSNGRGRRQTPYTPKKR